MNMQWSNITLICAIIISQLTIYGGAHPNSDHTTDVGNNVPWIFDTEEAMVPLVSVTDEQREQELKYQNTLQYAKNLCVMAVTAKNITMPAYIYHDISVMELYQLLDGSSLRRKYNLHQQLLDKLDHADTVAQEICKELRAHPPTRNVVFPTGESALVIEDLDAYEKSISDLTADKISTLFDELLGGGEIVIETKLLKTLTPESLSDINAQFLIRRVGDFYSVNLGDSFKGARRENVLGATIHDSEKLVAYEDWVNNKRNQIHYVAELINAENAQNMVKQINGKQMVFLQALWFELFKTIESQIRLLVNVRLFRRAVIEIISNPTSEGKLAQVSAKGLELIYDGLEYNILNDKQRISFHHKLEKLITMLRNMYDVDISHLHLQDETNYIDLNTTTESKVDKVELECASSHLVNYYKSMDTDVDIMKKTTRKMKELGFKKGVTHKNVMQTLAKTNTMVGHLADILVDTHDNILDIERDVNGIHDGEVDTEVSPVKLLDRVYKLTAELSGVRMIMIEIYKSSCEIYRCDIEGNHIDVPDSFIEEIAKLTKKAQIALANTQVRYFEFRKAAGLMKDKAMALERSHRMESGKTALKLYQELVKPRRGIDIILRYFAYIDDYKNELNKMERIIQNAKHTSTENKRYQILQNYFDASKSIHDSLLLEKIIQTAMDMEKEFETKVMTIEQHSCHQKQNMNVKSKNIKNTRKNQQSKTKPLTDYEDARGHGNLEGAYVISPPHGAQIWDVAHDIVPQSHRVDELPKGPIVLKLEEHIPQAVQPQQPTMNGDKDDDSIHQNSASDYSATPPLSFTSKTDILTTEQDTMPSVDKKTNMESGDLDQFNSFTSAHEPATDSDQHTSTSGETESSQTEKSNSEQWSQSADEVSDYSMLTDYEDARGHGNLEGAYVISPPHGAQIWDVAHDIIPQSHRVHELPKGPIVLKLEEHIPQAVQPQQPTMNGDKDDDSIHQNSASDYSATPPLSFTSKTDILTTEQDTMPSVDKKTNMESGDLDQFHSFTSAHDPATDSDQHTSTSGETESSQTEKTNSEQWSQSADEVSDYSMLTDYEDARGHGNLEGAYVISPPHGAQIWDVAHDIIPQSHRVHELPKGPIVLKLEEHIPQAVQPQQPTMNGDKDDGVCVPLCTPDDKDCADAVGGFYIGKLLDDAPDIYGFMANSGAYLYRGGMLLCRAAGATLGLVPNILSSMMPVSSDGDTSSRSQTPETTALDSMDQQVDSSPVEKTNKPMDMADVNVAPQHLEKSVNEGRSTMEPKLRSNLGTNRSSADDRPASKLLTRMVDEALSAPIVPSTSSSFATVTCTLVTLAYAVVLAG
ncbi:hypothetical protein BBOV_III000650 [Babesia bovis T2Bo]|uniref:Uncharacterized protein n=1 Tax=Babesia bovis TaxID=5865 RepID=A7AM48_BABBO|nr:hypothetical protein BBOV_III000650 [Babesia bovis T2Bo]EDO07632.1 hypothetical protein BBOV_III000650 [Babesia bovis T2Bo]|eukprot:XP_001611200.1 hypothetical protein [Babesia bovis T2Bo]